MTAPTARPVRFPADYSAGNEVSGELLDWDEVAARIAASLNYWLAATTEVGRPHLRPIDGVFVHETLAFGGSPETRWVRILLERPEVSVSLPDDDHAVILEGRAEVVTDAALPLADAVAAANAAKYPQYYAGDEAPAFRPFWALRPGRVFAWSLSDFPNRATRFDFDTT
jgi:general stress protein 26